MRLLRADTGEIKEFVSDRIPPYAILSHTWGSEEVTLVDWMAMEKAKLQKKQGYTKIQCGRDQAIKDGLEWIWVDT